MSYVLAVALNAAIDTTLTIPEPLTPGETHKAKSVLKLPGGKILQQCLVSLLAVGADMHPLHLGLYHIHRRWKHEVFGLLNIRLKIIHHIEGSKHIGERHSAQEFDTRREIPTGRQIHVDTGVAINNQIVDSLIEVR